jgi:hypothetical protein
MKLSTRDLQIVLLGICEYYDNRYRKGCAWLIGVNVIILMRLPRNPKTFYIIEHRGAGVCVLRHWYAVCLRDYVTKESQLYQLSLWYVRDCILPIISFYLRRKNCEKRLSAASCPSTRPYITRLPLEGFSWNFISEHFSKICRENSSFIKSDKNNGHFTWRSLRIYDHISLNSIFLLLRRAFWYM